jgi:F-type H+-transporting ATPase subunit epsilon
MRLKVLLPTEILVDEEVIKVTAEAENGSFCLLPRHIDFVAALVPGLLAFVTAGPEAEEFLAVDEGILVKCGPEVLVSTRQAVRGPELGQLRETVARTFMVLSSKEKRARSALATLEANFIRRFLKLEEYA